MRKQQPQRRQLLGRQVNHSITSPESPIGLQPESCEGTSLLANLAINAGRRGRRSIAPATRTCRRGGRSLCII
jgi:hypothetical protein